QPARILDLLMLARAVESHRLRELDVALQVRVGGCSEEPTWKVALVEDESLRIRPAVEQEPAVSGLDLSQPEVARHVIGPAPRFEAIQAWVLGTPWMDLFEDDAPFTHASAPLANRSALEGDDHPLRSFAANLKFDLARIEVRCDLKLLDRARRKRFQPHRLPYAGRRRVEPGRAKFGRALLASRDGSVTGRVLGADQKQVVAVACDARDVGGEGRVPTLVPGHHLPIDPNHRAIVDCAEMQKEALGCGSVESPSVPHDVRLLPIPDPGKVRLGRERNGDAAVEPFGRAGAELPFAVQVHPRSEEHTSELQSR